MIIRAITLNDAINLIPWAAIYSFGLFVPYNGRKILLTTITNKRDLYNKKNQLQLHIININCLTLMIITLNIYRISIK